MKPTILFLIALLFTFDAQAQNLVNNPSLETYTTCPTGSSQIGYATNWSAARNSPEYLNPCSASIYGTAPTNYFGTQVAATGGSYAGSLMYGSFLSTYLADIREFTYTTLSTPLVSGQTYYVSFKVNLCDNSNYACNKIGAQFATVYNSNAPINNTAQVFTNTVITDKVNWTMITGSFVAAANYNAIMIGNFFNDANTTAQFVGSSVSIGYNGYYMIDDLCVSSNPSTCTSILAVDWSDHALVMNGLNADISWKADPSNLTGFTVERARMGKEFEPIADLPAVQNQEVYAFRDFAGTEPLTLYRIRALGTDGSTHLSRVLEAEVYSSGINYLKAYPSPIKAGQQFHIEYGIQSEVSAPILVLDLAGKTVMEIPFEDLSEGFHNMAISTEGMQPGMYWIKAGTLTRPMVIE